MPEQPDEGRAAAQLSGPNPLRKRTEGEAQAASSRLGLRSAIDPLTAILLNDTRVGSRRLMS